MRRNYLTLAVLALVALLMGGCSPYTLTNSEVYNNANLADYHTFRIISPSEGKLPPGMQLVTYYNITAAIREQLTERGWAEDQNSDILVNIGLTVKKDLVNEPVTQTVPVYGPGYWNPTPPGPALPNLNGGPGPVKPPYAGPEQNGLVPYFMYPRSWYWNSPQFATVTQYVPTIYREGVLTMDIVNMKEMVPLFSASVATILDNGDSELRNLSGIDAAVKVLFSKFPIPVQK